MKLIGPFTVGALYYAELSGPDWEDYTSLSQVNDQSGSQKENQSPISQLTEHSPSWKPTQILEWSKNDLIFSQLTSSFQMPSREMKEETCDGTLTSVCHSNMNNERKRNYRSWQSSSEWLIFNQRISQKIPVVSLMPSGWGQAYPSEKHSVKFKEMDKVMTSWGVSFFISLHNF